MLTGGCQCGAVRYVSAGEPMALYVCHCLECRRQSASAFGMSLAVPSAGLTVTAGAPAFWSRPTDSGRTMRCAFCRNCGSRLWHQRSGVPDRVTIKAGSLDAPVDYASAIHIWTRGTRACPGLRNPARRRPLSARAGRLTP